LLEQGQGNEVWLAEALADRRGTSCRRIRGVPVTRSGKSENAREL
jgi:hypothetical protein